MNQIHDNIGTATGKIFEGGHAVIDDFMWSSESRVIIVAINWDTDHPLRFDPSDACDFIEIRIDWDGNSRTTFQFQNSGLTMPMMEVFQDLVARINSWLHGETIQRRMAVSNDPTQSYYR